MRFLNVLIHLVKFSSQIDPVDRRGIYVGSRVYMASIDKQTSALNGLLQVVLDA